MVDFEKQINDYSFAKAQVRERSAAVFPLVYGWMCAALAVSGAVAWFVATSELAKEVLSGNLFIGCVIAEFALVIAISAGIRKLPAAAAFALFALYSAVNGVTLSFVFLAYELPSVASVFFVSAAMFGGAALYGTLSKSDISGVGSFCGMALWGLVIASVVNIFLRSGPLAWFASVFGVAVFTGLAMYDAQKVKLLAMSADAMDRTTARKLALLGALELYLDFVNLFLYLLRLFGRRR